MTAIYKYLIIRFRPYAETGEFANIGIVAFNLLTEEATFRLAHRRFARIAHFFDARAHRAYSQVIENLRIELPRILEFLPQELSTSGLTAGSHFWEFRESSLLFSSPRVVKSSEPLDQLASELFDRFVRREFDKPDNAEGDLTKNIRRALRKHGLAHFRNITIEDDLIPLRLPLAVRDHGVAAIKPLAFDQKNPTHIIDYGAYWKKRLSYHLEKGNVQEGNLLLVLEPPTVFNDTRHEDAFSLATEELSSLPFHVSSSKHRDDGHIPAVLDFARRHPAPQMRLIH